MKIATDDLNVHQQQIANAQQMQELPDQQVHQPAALQLDDQPGLKPVLPALPARLQHREARRGRLPARAEHPESSYITFGYWDSLRKGLLAGDRLQLGDQQLERAYIDQNQREFEITRYVSLLLHDPGALIALKTTGECLVDLPEALFDTDYPGQYLRRLRDVSLTIPCVAGPYTSINCTLTLVSSKIRIDPSTGNGSGGASYVEKPVKPGSPVHLQLRLHRGDRDQPRPRRQRGFLGRLPRRALPAVRDGWSRFDMDDQHAAGV